MALNRSKVVQEAEKYVARGKVSSAIKEYRRLLAENPDDVTTLNRVGDLYVQSNQTDEAIRLFWDVAERYARDGFRTRAIAIFKKIIRTAPGRLDAYERLAELYAEERLVNDALQQYQVLVDYYIKHGNPASAAKILQKMAGVQPEDPSLPLRLAELYEKQQLHEKALAEYRKIAKLMLRHGKAEEAHQVFVRAVELAPQDLGFVTDLVLDLKDAGHTGLAARLLTRAVELNPQAERIAKIAGTLRERPAPAKAGEAAEVAPLPPEPAPGLPPVEDLAPRPASLGDDGGFVLDLDEAELLPGMDLVSPPATPGRPAATPHPEDEFVLELPFEEEFPSTRVRPPDELAAQGSEAPFGEVDLGDLSSLDFEPPSGVVGEELEAALGDTGTELPADIDWRFEEAGLDLDIALPSETQPLSLGGPPPPIQESTKSGLPVGIDTADLERSVQEIQRKPPPREAELLAEAEVFAKYELIEKAHDRIREVLQLNPRHLGALSLAVQLHLKEGRADRLLARAQQLARAAAEAGKLDIWTPIRQRLLHAGYDVAGEEFGPTQAAGARDGLSALVDSLVETPTHKKATRPTPPPKPAKRIEAELDALASQILSKPGKGKAKAAPAPTAPAAEPIEVTPATVAPSAPSAPVAPTAAEIPPSLAAAGAPAPPEVSRPTQPPGLGAVDEEELPGIRIPMKAPAASTPSVPLAPTPATPDELHWLDEVIANAPAAREADEKLFDDEEGFFDLAAELEQELSRDELFESGELVPMPKEPSLEEIVEGFKKGVAESLSPEDVDTHYNLGIAYREMGLLDDAIGEFQLAAKDTRYFVECSSMLGICFLEKGLPELAVKWYQRALDAPDLPEETALGLRYDLGTAQMAAGDKAAARATFIQIYGINSNFRDVVALLTELEPDA